MQVNYDLLFSLKCCIKTLTAQSGILSRRKSMFSNRPDGARIGAKIPDWMSNNLAGREK